jgi:hypothetical protein
MSYDFGVFLARVGDDCMIGVEWSVLCVCMYYGTGSLDVDCIASTK